MTLSTTTRAGRSKEAKARKQLTADQFFFYQNAGYVYDSKTETPEQGRLRCAKELAAAEAIGQRLGYAFEWEFDECPEVGIRLTHQTPMPSMRKWKTILGT
jgi:hypothetical protein